MDEKSTDMEPVPYADPSDRIAFAVNGLNRLSERRDDDAFVAELTRTERARTLMLAGDTPVLRRSASGAADPFFGLAEADSIGPAEERVLLGQSASRVLFATRLAATILVAPEAGISPAPFQASGSAVAGRDDLFALDLRSLATQDLLPAAELGAFAQAKSILHWHKFHRFCSNCGHATAAAAAGWRRECPNCHAQHFPRTDPVVIMLAVDGDNCLLGRQARFPKGNYSALAGFLEPGETIEAAVRREIFEESGIAIGRVDYLMSQPWPFPASLMIGCRAEAISRAVTVDTTELEDARWFSREEAAQMLAGTHPAGLRAPGPVAIAHHLLRAWVEPDQGLAPKFSRQG